MLSFLVSSIWHKFVSLGFFLPPGASLPFLRRLRMSQSSSSKKMFLRFKFWFSSFSYFLIGLLLRSIFCSITWMKLAWQRPSCFIFLRCFFESRTLCELGSKTLEDYLRMLRAPRPGDCGALGFERPWTILSVVWFFLLFKWRCTWLG